MPEMLATGLGGLLDVSLHPNFAQNRLVYLTYSKPGEGRGNATTAVMRARWDGGSTLTEVKDILVAKAYHGGPGTDQSVGPATGSYGSRLAWDRNGLLYVSLGDRNIPRMSQDPGSHIGKILRIRDDGSVPPDNPFVGKAGARPEIFTWGNRNPQGLARHPETGRIWEVEHGPKGGDELNILKAGANYGWPLVTYGVNYDGSKITDHRSLPGMEDALRTWVPSISPCGLTFYTADKFPGWKGSLFTGALSNYALFRIEVDGERYRSEERLLVDRLPYIRDVRQGPDGLLYLVTQSDDGGLFRLEPA
jgi:aldose sugar dehydrogenase